MGRILRQVLADLYIADATGAMHGEKYYSAAVFVSPGISGGGAWMTCYRKDNGSLARLKRQALPVRGTRAGAEADLIAYAEARGWPVEYEDGPET